MDPLAIACLCGFLYFATLIGVLIYIAKCT